MRIVAEALDVLWYPSLLVAWAAIILMPARDILSGRGCHVSLPLRRRLGSSRTLTLRHLLAAAVMATGVFALFGSMDLLFRVLSALWNLWVIDDWLFPDDRPRRKHEWALVRLRMPKPVKLRLVERWQQAPAPA